MENVGIVLITLGGLFTIYEQDKKKYNNMKEKFIEKPCDTQNQLVEKKESLDSVPSKINLASKNDMYTTLSGEKVNLNNFKHNNMVHYYGGKDTGKVAVSSRNDSILDNMIGNGSTSFNKKCQSIKDITKNLDFLLFDNKINLPIFFWDEGYSSIEALDKVKLVVKKSKNQKKIIDKFAAKVILQDFLNYMNKKNGQK